jgi:hypothetical protein
MNASSYEVRKGTVPEACTHCLFVQDWTAKSAKDIVGAWARRVFPNHDIPSHLVIASAMTLDHIWADHPSEILRAAQLSRETVYMLLAFGKDART